MKGTRGQDGSMVPRYRPVGYSLTYLDKGDLVMAQPVTKSSIWDRLAYVSQCGATRIENVTFAAVLPKMFVDNESNLST